MDIKFILFFLIKKSCFIFFYKGAGYYLIILNKIINKFINENIAIKTHYRQDQTNFVKAIIAHNSQI
jgi:hypothetical protein